MAHEAARVYLRRQERHPSGAHARVADVSRGQGGRRDKDEKEKEEDKKSHGRDAGKREKDRTVARANLVGLSVVVAVSRGWKHEKHKDTRKRGGCARALNGGDSSPRKSNAETGGMRALVPAHTLAGGQRACVARTRGPRQQNRRGHVGGGVTVASAPVWGKRRGGAPAPG